MRGNFLGEIHGDNGFDKHWVCRHSAVANALSTDKIKQEETHLIAGQKTVTLGSFDGDAASVTVRIGGKKEVSPRLLTELQPQFHGLTDFGIGIGAGGKMPIRLLLLGHKANVCKSGL